MSVVRVLVTGPRAWSNTARLYRAFADVEAKWPGATIVLVHGAASGLDHMARGMAKHRGWITEEHYPDYVKYRSWEAPLIRNQEMVDAGADVCLAFLLVCEKPRCRKPYPHWTHGTDDCITRAEKAGIPIWRYEI